MDSLELRLTSYDLAFLSRLIEAFEEGKKRGSWQVLKETIRKIKPPSKAPKARAQIESELRRLRELGAPDAIVENMEYDLDPVRYLLRKLQSSDGECSREQVCALAARDQCDVPDATLSYLVWLLAPETIRLDAEWWTMIEGPPPERIYIPMKESATYTALFGSGRLRIADVEPFPPTPHGRGLDNYHSPDALRAARVEVARIFTLDLFSLAKEWRHAMPYIWRESRRWCSCSYDEGVELHAKLRQDADWIFVSEMYRVRGTVRRILSTFDRAEKNGWGVISIDGWRA